MKTFFHLIYIWIVTQIILIGCLFFGILQTLPGVFIGLIGLLIILDGYRHQKERQVDE